MRKRTMAGSLAAVVVAVGFCGCKKEDGPNAAVKEIPAPSGDTNFTPPEIRRPMPSEDSSKSKSVKHDTVAAVPAKPGRDTAVRVAPPAAPAPTASPTPAPVPVAKATITAPAAKPVVPPPAQAPQPVAKAGPGDPGPDGEWVLQVNIHKSEADAKAQIAKLAAQGIPAYAIAVPTEGAKLAGQYWRVRVGRFLSRAQAQAYGDGKIVPAGLKFWIDKKSNEARFGGTP